MDSFATKTLSCRIYRLEFCLVGQLHDDVTKVIFFTITRILEMLFSYAN